MSEAFGAMRVCPKHERAHLVSEPCPWREPVADGVGAAGVRSPYAPADEFSVTPEWSHELGAWVARYLEDA